MLSELAAQFHRVAAELRIPNAQLAVLDRGEVELAHAGSPDSEVLRFPFASATKLFTATVATQLARDGDLELDVETGKLDAEFAAAPGAVGAFVSPRHLLSHTSGLVCDVEGGADTARGLLAAAGGSGLLFAPGSAFSYSNVGFALMGRLIESAGGMSWREAVETFLLRPLGIDPAYLPGPGSRAGGPPLATGHAVTRAGAVPVQVTVPAAMAPAAALAGTGRDLLALGRLHLDERGSTERALLDDEGVREMRRPAAGVEPYGLADGWGLGWALYGPEDRPWLGLDALGGGTTCNLRVHPQEGTVLALLTDSTAGLSLWRALTGWLGDHGRDVGAVPAGGRSQAGARSASLPAKCAAPAEGFVPPSSREGTWSNGTMRCRITHEAGALRLEDDTETHYRLDLDDRGAFSAQRVDVPEVPYEGRFLPPESGRGCDLMQFAGRVLRREVP